MTVRFLEGQRRWVIPKDLFWAGIDSALEGAYGTTITEDLSEMGVNYRYGYGINGAGSDASLAAYGWTSLWSDFTFTLSNRG